MSDIPSRPPTLPRSTLRVLSCNLLSGRVPGGALIDLIEGHAIDVLCPQELDEKTARSIASVLPEGQLDPDPARRGLGVAARAPVFVERVSLPGRSAWVARLEPQDWPHLQGAIEIVNVHFLAPHTWPYFPRRERRAGQLAGLLAYLRDAATLPRAIVGDFNATPRWPLYRSLNALYRDGVQDLLARPPPTWPHSQRYSIPGFLRIDHCLVSGLRVVAAQRIALPRSDHYGLCVDLRPEGESTPE